MLEMKETQVLSLGREDPLEEGMATPSTILVWKTSWSEEPGGLHSPWSRKKEDRTQYTQHSLQGVINNTKIFLAVLEAGEFSTRGSAWSQRNTLPAIF